MLSEENFVESKMMNENYPVEALSPSLFDKDLCGMTFDEMMKLYEFDGQEVEMRDRNVAQEKGKTF